MVLMILEFEKDEFEVLCLHLKQGISRLFLRLPETTLACVLIIFMTNVSLPLKRLQT